MADMSTTNTICLADADSSLVVSPSSLFKLPASTLDFVSVLIRSLDTVWQCALRSCCTAAGKVSQEH